MLKRTEIGICSISTNEAKDFMRYTGTAKDAEVKTALLTAIRRIEDQQNVSLRPMTVQLHITSPEGYNPLYLHPVSEIKSVKDAATGADIVYETYTDRTQIKVQTAKDVIVEYTTSETPDMADYRHAILTLTALIFDGVTEDEAFRKVFTTYLTAQL